MKFILTIGHEKGPTVEVEARTPKEAVKKLYPNSKVLYSYGGPLHIKVSNGKWYSILSVLNP